MEHELSYAVRSAAEKLASRFPVKTLIAASDKLSKLYKKETYGGERPVSTELLAAVYSVVRMPATYAAAHRALLYTTECTDLDIVTAADIGAGTGTSVWAAADLFPGLEHITCIEREKAMYELGKRLIYDVGSPCDTEWKTADVTLDAPMLSADLVIASYMIGETADDEKTRKKLIEVLFACANKLLVLIEPGTVTGYKNILSYKKTLSGLGAYIAAPCPAASACPVENTGDWCHFSARTSRTKLHKLIKNADVPYEDEKFCYIAAAKEPCVPCTARILRHPVKESGKITLNLCTPDGLNERIITKKDSLAFKAARKAEWGEAFGLQ